MAKKYRKLKALMFEKEVKQADLVPVIGRKTAYIATRMNGKYPWNIAEMKAIGEFLEIPRSRWLEFFMEDESMAIDFNQTDGTAPIIPRAS